jgi:hypothetical protein
MGSSREVPGKFLPGIYGEVPSWKFPSPTQEDWVMLIIIQGFEDGVFMKEIAST